MYAVIKTGGRQAKVQEGDLLQVERLRATDEVEFEPVLIADDDGKVITDRDRLAKMAVKAKVVGEVRGKKVDVFHYRNKSGYRKSAGHRQTYTTVEITKIPKTARKAAAKKSDDKPAAEKAEKTTAKKATKGEDE
jgi:large subunit ribosomal protein L21